jgi:predicted  nucleic acid-binding Zn-ribbon protein
MSSADPEEVSVEIEREGVTVEKSFEPDDFPVPAIAFVIRSERDVPVDVTLVDTVPDDIQAEDIGFHPKYGAEHWRNEGEELIFERPFEAGEEYTTVYGLRARDTEDIGRFLGEPDLAEVDPPKDSSQVVRDVMGEGESGAAPGTSDDDLEAAIAAADVGSTPDSSTTGQSGSTDDVVAASPGSVASMLAEGIRAGQVSDDDLEVIRDALGTADGSSNSLEVRIDHLQSEVADLKAYSDALEEFIDENGEARTLVRELRETIEGVEGDVADVESEVESVSGEVTEATERLDDLGEDVSRIDEAVDRVGTDVADVESSLSTVEGRIDELDTSLASVDEELTSVREEMDDVRGEVDAVRDEIPEGRIEAMDDRMDELQEELEALAEMRKRMASVFGGMGGGAAEAAEATGDDDADDGEGDDGTDEA